MPLPSTAAERSPPLRRMALSATFKGGWVGGGPHKSPLDYFSFYPIIFPLHAAQFVSFNRPDTHSYRKALTGLARAARRVW